MYVCESDWYTHYGPVKHWVHCKSISHPPHQLSLCPLLDIQPGAHIGDRLKIKIVFCTKLAVLQKLLKLRHEKYLPLRKLFATPGVPSWLRACLLSCYTSGTQDQIEQFSPLLETYKTSTKGLLHRAHKNASTGWISLNFNSKYF